MSCLPLLKEFTDIGGGLETREFMKVALVASCLGYATRCYKVGNVISCCFVANIHSA